MEYLSWHGVTMDKTWEFMQPTSVKRLQDILTGVGQKVTRETVNSFIKAYLKKEPSSQTALFTRKDKKECMKQPN